MIDCYASQRHYWSHLEPIWEALPAAARGGNYGRHTRWPPDRGGDRPVMVASYADAKTMQRRPAVYVEHGAGQHYPDDPQAAGNGSYSGGDGLDHVRLFICPNGTVASRWKMRYPAADTAAVGCPRLDRWGDLTRRPARQARTPATVALVAHWECQLCPEARSAYAHYRAALDGLAGWCAGRGWRLMWHAHPRADWPHRDLLAGCGAPEEPDLDRLLAEADVVVADNTSVMWEAAALDIPLVVLDAPWYRPDRHHGLRFWTWADTGIRIGQPGQLRDAIAQAIVAGPADRREVRDAAAQAIYSHRDGRAAERAAQAIIERNLA